MHGMVVYPMIFVSVANKGGSKYNYVTNENVNKRLLVTKKGGVHKRHIIK